MGCFRAILPVGRTTITPQQIIDGNGAHRLSTDRWSFDSQRWRTAYELDRAALDADHEVTYFAHLDGALVPVAD